MSLDKDQIRKALNDSAFKINHTTEEIKDWLCSLIGENEQLEHRTADKTKGWGECEAQNQQLRDELEQYQSLNKVNSDSLLKAQSEITRLSFELAAKNKALQMIVNAKVHSCDSASQLAQIAQQAIGVSHET